MNADKVNVTLMRANALFAEDASRLSRSGSGGEPLSGVEEALARAAHSVSSQTGKSFEESIDLVVETASAQAAHVFGPEVTSVQLAEWLGSTNIAQLVAEQL